MRYGKNTVHNQQYLIADPGDDVLEYGLTPAEKTQIQQYITFSRQANYRNLWLWLSCQFSQAACGYQEPQQLPWHGIYHPGASAAFTDIASYRQQFCLPDRPTIAMIFSREEWIWGNLEYKLN
ncbi:CobN component of cobalt chelatase involved in B12 biosynthesis [Sporomusa ovata]|uniref:CobN component of cobalt chelatase involved in B12 biosynthesis n=1 Tax=Sporomusa ovata TaxID=2378 RepID=A0A0U1L429_9FIRM|nr:cobaltochelatase subunit CobN [Sporomusa ovata]CQR74420.1 CobN component of cobalt chelatase involved in B12 biosynthesis [Sporomusa ovata]